MTFPTLDQVAVDPAALQDVPREILAVLAERAALAHHRVMWAMYTGVMGGTQNDDLLDVHEAAPLIGIAPLTLSHHARRKYAHLRVETGARTLRFSRRAIEQWRASQAGSPAAAPVAPSRERKPIPVGPGSHTPGWLTKGNRGRRT